MRSRQTDGETKMLKTSEVDVKNSFTTVTQRARIPEIHRQNPLLPVFPVRLIHAVPMLY